MDDKQKVLRLYEKMNKIKLKTSDLIESIGLLNEELEKSLVINNKAYKSKDVASQRNQLKEIKKNVKYDVMNNLKNHL